MPRKIPIATNASPPAIGTFSQAIRTGDLVFTNSLTGRHPETGKLEMGLEAQTHRMFANLDAVLNAAGCARADIVRVNLVFKEIVDFKAVDEIYAAWIPDRGESPLPVRTAFAAAALPAGALVMIDVVATSPGAADESE